VKLTACTVARSVCACCSAAAFADACTVPVLSLATWLCSAATA
jgi:hypothetical protein